MSSIDLQQAHPANVDALAAHGQVVAARIGVAGGDGGDDLRQRDVELQQFPRIDFRDILARAAAERRRRQRSRKPA